MTKDDLVQAFAERHKEELRWSKSEKRWFVFEDGQWKKDRTKLAFHMVRLFCREHNPPWWGGRMSTTARIERLAKDALASA